MSYASFRIKNSQPISRWVARIWSLVSLGFVLLLFIGEGFNPVNLTLQEWLLSLFFPLGVCLGLILAWRWERLGGAITVLSFLAFYATHFVIRQQWPGGPFFVLLAAPGLLFLIPWILLQAEVKV